MATDRIYAEPWKMLRINGMIGSHYDINIYTIAMPQHPSKITIETGTDAKGCNECKRKRGCAYVP
jgi:hypothetical protein